QSLNVPFGLKLGQRGCSAFITSCRRRGSTMYNQNAALRQGTFVSTFHGEFVQYAVNKVGFNVRTLDWVDTCFSDVGTIAVVTPGIKE
ncbi:unnamed protein product, partial [Porites evermanni]